MATFTLNPALDADALAETYAAHGRLQIREFLNPACADALLGELEQSHAWKLAVNNGDRIINYSDAAFAELGEEKQAKLDRAVILGGRYGFQFRYDSIRLAGEETAASLLAGFADFLSSPEMVAFMRTLTGCDAIDFADAHASRYRAGHFLTAHDDAVDTMGRRAAYVLNLTREWLVDWGGLLLFYDGQGNVERGFTPSFNTLNIFSVPQPHSVTWVNPLAAAPRYAVTGWLRSRTDS